MAVEKTLINQRAKFTKVYATDDDGNAVAQTLTARVVPSEVTAEKLGALNESIGWLMKNVGTGEEPSNAFSLEKFLIENVAS